MVPRAPPNTARVLALGASPLQRHHHLLRAPVPLPLSALFHFFFRHLAEGAILDSHKPNQYGPRGFGAELILPKSARVSKAWPTTHAKKAIANNLRPTRLRSAQGSSVWA